jgi:hypothetical protein
MFLSNVVIALTVAAATGSLFYGRRIKRHISRFDGVGFCLICSRNLTRAHNARARKAVNSQI